MTRSHAVRTWLFWTAGALAFPLSGLAGMAAAGRVNGPLSALIGGAVTGLVVGTGQVLASGLRLSPYRWIPATAIGMGIGLMVGAATVGYRTSLSSLMVMGALTGLALGLAQMAALPAGSRHRWTWAAALPILWALGWTVTTLAGIDVERQYTVYGMSGALTFSALSGLLLLAILPAAPVGGSPRPSRSAKIATPA